MIKLLILGNTGLDEKNNSTNLRMRKIFEVLHYQKECFLDYYKLRDAKLNVPHINYLNKDANSNPIKAFLFLIKVNSKYDLLIAETFNASIAAYLYYLLKRTPFIWRQFGTTFNDDLNFKNYFNPKILLKLLLHKLIANSNGCKGIVCTEDGCANSTLFLDKLKILKNKFYIVKNQRTENINLRKTNCKERQTFNIVQIGRINTWKKIHLVIDVIIDIKKERPDIFELIQLDIIGIIDDKDYEMNLVNNINLYGLENHVFIEQNLQYSEIEEKLHNSDLSISLTAYNPIIESLQNEVPVITYEYGEVNSIFKDCPAVFVLAKNIKKSTNLSNTEENQIKKELKDKLIESFYKREKLHNIGIEGRKFVEKEFPTIEEHSKEIVDIYMKVINAL
ncbi:glycosyltransferase [Aliarcobacter butzleri]|uniref:glycosyltransferase n=1 Tax=Aliarcobacter butzleri TaxID=28197 RepID=UPI00263CEF9D|nr:glycosyltransferase [Aliarcobacter butzleri]MDN5050691.1 glycosyltransferase [Aliarcobacter butzleri]MDN5057864.1 glycosyltransferase [Aliarcobacter butzleri]